MATKKAKGLSGVDRALKSTREAIAKEKARIRETERLAKAKKNLEKAQNELSKLKGKGKPASTRKRRR